MRYLMFFLAAFSMFIAAPVYADKAVAILTSSEDWHYQVLASGFAGRNTHIVVTTSPASLDSEAQEKLMFVDRIIILGSENVVSAAVEQAINGLKTEPGFVKAAAERVGGRDVYETAALLADKWREPKGLIVVRADVHPDALVGSQLSGAASFPMLFTESDELPLATLNKIKELKLEVTILGLHVAVSQEVEEEIKKAGVSVVRIGGADRYETAALVGKKYVENIEARGERVESVTLVNGVTSSGYGTLALHSAVAKSVIAYTGASNSMPEATREFINEVSLFHGVKSSLMLTQDGSELDANDRSYLEAIGVSSEVKQSDVKAFSLEVAESVRNKLTVEGRLIASTASGGGSSGEAGGGNGGDSGGS